MSALPPRTDRALPPAASSSVPIERDWRPAHLGLTSLSGPLKALQMAVELATRAAGRHRSSTTLKPFDSPSLFRRGWRRHAR